ncbi:MAG: transcription-repair coupling factor [Acidobacteria bacterium]|nr:transcription-repair coupling factor [Acidobacteriota bacterium]MCG3194477.1 Transcription-repair-coupling factor [Thermoanaerobaculia bacterium]
MPERPDPLLSKVLEAPACQRLLSLLEARVLEDSPQPVALTGAPAGLAPYLLQAASAVHGLKWAVVFPHEKEALAFLRDAEACLAPQAAALFPSPSLTPYQGIPPSLKIRRDEFGALARINAGLLSLLVLPARALYRRLPRPEALARRTLRLRRGQTIEISQIVGRLLEEGYSRTDLVTDCGDIAVRGGLLDVFPPHLPQPVRFELDFDELESIRSFDPDTQRSTGDLDQVLLPPLALTPDNRRNREEAQRVLDACRTADDDPPLPRDLDAPRRHDGLEEILPLLAEGEGTGLFEYLRSFSIAVSDPDAVAEELSRSAEILLLDYEHCRKNGKVVPHPMRLTADPDALAEEVRQRTLLALSPAVPSGEVLAMGAESNVSFEDRLPDAPREILRSRRDGMGVVLTATAHGELEHLVRFLNAYDIDFSGAEGPVKTEISPGSCRVVLGGPVSGFLWRSAGLYVLSSNDIFGEPRTVSPKRKAASEAFLSDLRDLRPGDIVVHRDYGLGRFAGLVTIDDAGVRREMVDLRYAGDAKLMVPVERLDLIQKYASAGEGPAPVLDKLGGTGWAKRKASVRKAVKDIAGQLLTLYARRATSGGYSFSKDSPWQKEFEDSFEFTETPDQLSAIRDIKKDMESEKPMDRLLCGDVGYGKTEVAMRAIFKAVLDGKQAALLCPTTILADQHFRTLKRRFAAFPVSIDILSRFQPPEQRKETLRRLSEGTLDVVVATHRLLSKDVAFKDLGLLVVDEEQRFGVAQKEKIKEWRASVDVLSMSATPIPRSLNLSLAGIRDLSVIETPPKDRLAVSTQVVPLADDVIREAIRAELDRGGQVYFVHNRVESLGFWREKLTELVPEVRIALAHGQMNETELERGMRAFTTRAADLLLATTIVENGLDIPSANTMIIDRADLYGLAQLYQLRGRVGRSDKPAYCWLLVPPGRPLTDDARRRLKAIQEFSDLGAGFRIAARDLEIRGAGNMLGGEQSGHIDSVGFETYMQLLEEAIAESKGEPVPEVREVTIQLGVPLGLPAKWIGEESLRMAVYKRLAAAEDAASLDRLEKEVRDRYGVPPPEFGRLVELSRLRLMARSLGVKVLQRRGPELSAVLERDHKLDPDRVLLALKKGELAASGPDAFRYLGAFEGLEVASLLVPARAASVLAGLARPAALAAIRPFLPSGSPS